MLNKIEKEPTRRSKRKGEDRGQSIRDSDKKPDEKKQKVDRCSSPSHFLADEDFQSSYMPKHYTDLPDHKPVNRFLHAVASMYYRPKSDASNTEVWVPSAYDNTEYPTLDMLQSPLRKPSILDSWTPKEVALFESGICSIGKDFHEIARLIGTKDTPQVVEFYYTWKKGAHYQMWKYHQKPVAKFNPVKEKKREKVDKMMKDF